MGTAEVLEHRRLQIQQQLDGQKLPADRNRLGQFATPASLAVDILKHTASYLSPDQPIRFLDPAFGTGAFYSALLRLFPGSSISSATGYEIDPQYGQRAIELWAGTPLNIHIADFTRIPPPDSDRQKPNLLVCNPPYVRHHHLSVDRKKRLCQMVLQATGIRLNGLSGLYCYFLLLAHRWMAENGLGVWLIPSEFMDVNYGHQVKEYLLKCVTLLRIHRFEPDDRQFEDALVSSTVIWLKNALPAANHVVELTYGGSVAAPEKTTLASASALIRTAKWTGFQVPAAEADNTSAPVLLSDFFEIKRGLATGANDFFILSAKQAVERQIPAKFLVPILPSPRYLFEDEIEADAAGNPATQRKLFLLTCDLPEREIRDQYPTLWNYLQAGLERGVHETYLCRQRSPWYFQERRAPTPFLCTYMGRKKALDGKPFRFILNHSQATAANVYLMLYPRPFLDKMLREDAALARAVWNVLNRIPSEVLIEKGRVYGGGLYKLEPKELGRVPAGDILSLLPNTASQSINAQSAVQLCLPLDVSPSVGSC